MSNKTQLQTNNTALDGYIARINAAKEVVAGLPEAGGSEGGGSVETVNVTLVNTNMDDDYYICGVWVDNGYISSYGTDVYCDDSKIKTAVKNSYIPINSGILKSITGSYAQIGSIGTATFYTLSGDCTITLK